MDKGLEHILRLKAIQYHCDETEDTLTWWLLRPHTPHAKITCSSEPHSTKQQANWPSQQRLWGDWLQTELLQINHKSHKVFWETIHTAGAWLQVLQKEQSSSKVHWVLSVFPDGSSRLTTRQVPFLCKSGHRHLCCFTSDHMLQETPSTLLLAETRINCYLPSKLSLTSTTRISPSPLLHKTAPSSY